MWLNDNKIRWNYDKLEADRAWGAWVWDVDWGARSDAEFENSNSRRFGANKEEEEERGRFLKEAENKF